MEERIIQFRVGVVVIAAALVAGILVFLFGEGVRGQYTVYLKYKSAPGVTVDTPVRKNGVLIGRVAAVELVDEGVVLTLKIDDNREIRLGEVPRIGTASLLGDAVINFVPGGPGSEQGLVQPDAVLTNGIIESNPLQAIGSLAALQGDIQSAIASIDNAGQGVAGVSQQLSDVLGGNEDQLKSLVAKSDLALDNINSVMTNLNELVGDDEIKQQLRKTVMELPMVLADARATLNEAKSTIKGFDRVSSRAEANLANLEELTRPLGERGDEIAASLERTIRNADELLGQLVMFTEAINSGKGTLGKLIYDPGMYNELSQTVGTVQELVKKLRPIISDVRIFTDKIARDPRILGAKGALDRRPAGMGVKGIPAAPIYPR
jgi:phospholipid/cholesterol/gamma-HCH transport system substrate-binding protein